MAGDHPDRMSFGHLFCTKRLVFRALENNSEHTAFIRDIIVDDPETYAQSTDRLLAPLTIDDVERDVAGLVRSLLSVIICLRPTVEEDDEDDEEEDDDDDDDDDDDETKEHKGNHTRGEPTAHDLTAIGWLTLDCHTLTLHHRSCTLGIMIASAHQGEGYGTEAINWALDWAFRVAAMHAVRLSCFSFNDRAVKLYQRLGFVKEGVAREAYYYDCEWYNRILFSILDREWAALRRASV